MAENTVGTILKVLIRKLLKKYKKLARHKVIIYVV